jgi:hypothetical protein
MHGQGGQVGQVLEVVSDVVAAAVRAALTLLLHDLLQSSLGISSGTNLRKKLKLAEILTCKYIQCF